MNETRRLLLEVKMMSPSAGQAIIYGILIFLFMKAVSNYRKTSNIIGVGFLSIPIPFISSWIAAIRFMRDPVGLVYEGLAKTKNGMFRIATIQGEYILISDREKVAEYLRAPDDVLSFQDGANDQQQIPWTMGYGVGYRTYHVAVVKGHLAKSITPHFPELIEEVNLAFDELIGDIKDVGPPLPVPLYDTLAMTIARFSNLVFVGQGLHHNEKYLRNAIDYAQGVVISAELLRMFPGWIKDILANFVPATAYRKRAMKYLGDIVATRLRQTDSGELKERPDDLIQWLIDGAPPIERTVPQLVERIMALNVASIHTTTMTLAYALYTLAAEPDKYTAVLRTEVLENCEDGKITANTVQHLDKMDSFIRESARLNNAGLMAMQRNAKKPFTFSDGTYIPAGAKVGSPTLVVQRGVSLFKDADVFDGLRFYNAAREGGAKKTVVSTGPDFQLFGHGRHPCPGRFYAVQEMKIIFAAMLLRYDLSLRPGTGPRSMYIATMAVPDSNLKVLFKKAKYRD